MKFHEFINKYINRKIDFDNSYGAQCVDVFRQYCKDVLNIPHTGAVEGAKDLFLNYEKLPLEKKYFIQILSDKIKYGDVIVWGETPTNRYGHVAIVVSNIGNKKVLILEQDGFKQDGAKLSVRTIANCIGILRFKGGVE